MMLLLEEGRWIPGMQNQQIPTKEAALFVLCPNSRGFIFLCAICVQKIGNMDDIMYALPSRNSV